MSTAQLISGFHAKEDVFAYSTADNEIVLANIGDYGSADTNETNVASMVVGWNPDAVFTTGDNSYSGADYATDVEPYYGDLVDRKLVYPCPGNHDWDDGTPADLSAYFSYFSDTVSKRYYYRKTLGPVSLFMLDSCSDTPDGYTSSSYQAGWLEDEASACRSPWKIAVNHHCPYSSGSFHGSVSTAQWDYSGADIDIVISGHEHNYERLYTGGVYYLVNGAGGGSLYNFGTALSTSQKRYNSLHGAAKLMASPTRLRWEFYSYDGTLVDSLTLEK